MSAGLNKPCRLLGSSSPGGRGPGELASLLGLILTEMGSIEEALTQFRRGLELAPDRVEAAYFLVQLTKVRAGDEALQALEAMLPRLS